MIKKKQLDIDVLTATKQRIIKIFQSGNKIRMSFSGGKDSIVLADIVYNLCISGQIDKSLLEVIFVDEEAMYDEVIDIVKMWRIKFMQIGVKFNWYCIQVKHYNCLNSLTDEEIFVCWDETQKENWVRTPPDFAIRTHPLLDIGHDNYQSFFAKLDKYEGKIDMIGIRVAESVQRQKNIANMKSAVTQNKCYPIYDWLDADIWLYIYKHNLQIPNVYENLYRIGTPVNRLRISQFFSIDTAKSLVSMNEMYPNLMSKVIKREPNAYLCAMYWDTEMFGKSTRKRKELEGKTEQKDYKQLLFDLFKNPIKLNTKNQFDLLNNFKMQIARFPERLNQNIAKKMYDCILAGDPKQRTYRSILQCLHTDYVNNIKKEMKK